MIKIHCDEEQLVVLGHSAEPENRTYESSNACASITAIVQTLLYGILMERDDINYVLEPGCFVLDLQNLDPLQKYLIAVFMVGAENIAKSYERYVQIV